MCLLKHNVHISPPSLFFIFNIIIFLPPCTFVGNHNHASALSDQVSDLSKESYAHNLTPWSSQVTSEAQALAGLTILMREELNAISKKRILIALFIVLLPVVFSLLAICSMNATITTNN